MFLTRLLLVFSSLTISLILTQFPTIAQEKQGSSILFVAQKAEGKIKEEDVEKFIKNTDQALESQNVDQILSYFAPFAYSEVTLNTDAQAEILKINGLEEHRLYFQANFQNIKTSEVLFDDYQISLTEDQSIAYVYRTRLVNITTNDGKIILVSSKMKVRLGLVSEELKVISLEQTSEINLRPQS